MTDPRRDVAERLAELEANARDSGSDFEKGKAAGARAIVDLLREPSEGLKLNNIAPTSSTPSDSSPPSPEGVGPEYCAFCGRRRHTGEAPEGLRHHRFVGAFGALICESCVGLASGILREASEPAESEEPFPYWCPRCGSSYGKDFEARDCCGANGADVMEESRRRAAEVKGPAEGEGDECAHRVTETVVRCRQCGDTWPNGVVAGAAPSPERVEAVPTESPEGRKSRMEWAYRQGYRYALDSDCRTVVLLHGPDEHDWVTVTPEEWDEIAALRERSDPDRATRTTEPERDTQTTRQGEGTA